MEFELGRTYSGYKFLDVVARSRTTVSYRVQNTLAQRIEILTALPAGARDDQDAAERLMSEMRIRARLAHPHIVAFFTALPLEGQLVMTTEMFEGVPLSERLQLGPLSWQEAVEAALQVLGAAAAGHEQQVVHRDITPGNILCGPNGIWKLTNYSLACQLNNGNGNGTGSMVGNPRYISPEQVKGTHDLDHRSDLYSIGAVLYEMLCGRPPFDSKSQFELMLAHVNQKPVRPSEVLPKVPAFLDAIVLKALEKDPAARYQTATEFSAALAAVRVITPAPEPVAAASPEPVAIVEPNATPTPVDEPAPAAIVEAVTASEATPVIAEQQAPVTVEPPIPSTEIIVPAAAGTETVSTPEAKVAQSAATDITPAPEPQIEAKPVAAEVEPVPETQPAAPVEMAAAAETAPVMEPAPTVEPSQVVEQAHDAALGVETAAVSVAKMEPPEAPAAAAVEEKPAAEAVLTVAAEPAPIDTNPAEPTTVVESPAASVETLTVEPVPAPAGAAVTAEPAVDAMPIDVVAVVELPEPAPAVESPVVAEPIPPMPAMAVDTQPTVDAKPIEAAALVELPKPAPAVEAPVMAEPIPAMPAVAAGPQPEVNDAKPAQAAHVVELPTPAPALEVPVMAEPIPATTEPIPAMPMIAVEPQLSVEAAPTQAAPVVHAPAPDLTTDAPAAEPVPAMAASGAQVQSAVEQAPANQILVPVETSVSPEPAPATSAVVAAPQPVIEAKPAEAVPVVELPAPAPIADAPAAESVLAMAAAGAPVQPAAEPAPAGQALAPTVNGEASVAPEPVPAIPAVGAAPQAVGGVKLAEAAPVVELPAPAPVLQPAAAEPVPAMAAVAAAPAAAAAVAGTNGHSEVHGAATSTLQANLWEAAKIVAEAATASAAVIESAPPPVPIQLAPNPLAQTRAPQPVLTNGSTMHAAPNVSVPPPPGAPNPTQDQHANYNIPAVVASSKRRLDTMTVVLFGGSAAFLGVILAAIWFAVGK